MKSIVTLSRSLGFCTVAEAVETGDQVAILRELGAETAQGYFFSAPLTAQEACDLANMVPHPCFSARRCRPCRNAAFSALSERPVGSSDP